MRKHLIIPLFSITITVALSACGGGSCDDPNDPSYQPDPTKSIGNDGSIYQHDPLPPPTNPLTNPINPPNNPNITIPTNPVLLSAPTRI